jgi:hypothetical protein
LTKQATRLRLKRARRDRNHQERYMSRKPRVSNRRYVFSLYICRYCCGSRFCWMTVPMTDVAARRMRTAIVSLREQRKSHADFRNPEGAEADVKVCSDWLNVVLRWE